MNILLGEVLTMYSNLLICNFGMDKLKRVKMVKNKRK